MLSIILPLCERQHHGWGALRSALEQDGSRADYEVIVVLGEPWAREAEDDAEAQALLARCDRLVAFDADPAAWEHRVRVFQAGALHARGDYLFFMEGHTILRRSLVRDTLAFFAAQPTTVLASAYPNKISRSPLARLVDRHKLGIEAGDAAHVRFGLGGQSAVRRALFAEFAPGAEAFGLYGDALIDDQLHRTHLPLANLPEPYCLHSNDFPDAHWRRYFAYLGAEHFRYFDTPQSRIVLAASQRGPLGVARLRWAAALLAAPCAAMGWAWVRLAVALDPHLPLAALLLFRGGMRLSMLGGFCRAALTSTAPRARPVSAPLRGDVSV